MFFRLKVEVELGNKEHRRPCRKAQSAKSRSEFEA